jgi:hypothetical protein
VTVVPKMYLSGGATNADPSLSIGGAKSSVAVSASKLNNLFDDISGDEAAAGHVDYRMVYVENGGDTDWVDPVAWLGYQPRSPDSPYTENGATVKFGMADAGKNAEEAAIADDTTAPDDVSFDDPSTKLTGTALPTPDYEAGDYIGIWIEYTTPLGQGYDTGADWSLVIEGDEA